MLSERFAGDFMLNVFFIMFPLIFHHFLWREKMIERPLLHNTLCYLLFSIPMLLCMLFPFVNNQGVHYDLRNIPLILACLYTNFFTSLGLLFFLMLGRYLISNDMGALFNIVSAIVLFCLMMSFLHRFRSQGSVKKIYLSAIIYFIGKMVGKLINLLLFDHHFYNYSQFALFAFIESLFVALVVYIIEAVKRNAELRKELMDSEKMKVASVISASVAHEIRNPLTAVRGFIQLLTASDVEPNKKQLYGQICLEEIDRAHQIITDYLSLAKPFPEKNEQIEVADELEYISNVLSSYAHIKNVDLQIDKKENLYILGDRQKFRQSLINIAKNGIEAMGNQGGTLKLSAFEQNNNIIITISDTGTGMTRDQVQRLGTPYFSTKDKGTGLGTMVAFSIIRSMIGKVEVTSELGKGTEYNIVFPKAKSVF